MPGDKTMHMPVGIVAMQVLSTSMIAHIKPNASATVACSRCMRRWTMVESAAIAGVLRIEAAHNMAVTDG